MHICQSTLLVSLVAYFSSQVDVFLVRSFRNKIYLLFSQEPPSCPLGVKLLLSRWTTLGKLRHLSFWLFVYLQFQWLDSISWDYQFFCFFFYTLSRIFWKQRLTTMLLCGIENCVTSIISAVYTFSTINAWQLFTLHLFWMGDRVQFCLSPLRNAISSCFYILLLLSDLHWVFFDDKVGKIGFNNPSLKCFCFYQFTLFHCVNGIYIFIKAQIGWFFYFICISDNIEAICVPLSSKAKWQYNKLLFSWVLILRYRSSQKKVRKTVVKGQYRQKQIRNSDGFLSPTRSFL